MKPASYELLCIKRLNKLEELANLTFFLRRAFLPSSSKRKLIVGKFPKSLKSLEIRVKLLLLGSDVLT